MKETEALHSRLGTKFGAKAGRNKLKHILLVEGVEVGGRKIPSGQIYSCRHRLFQINSLNLIQHLRAGQ